MKSSLLTFGTPNVLNKHYWDNSKGNYKNLASKGLQPFARYIFIFYHFTTTIILIIDGENIVAYFSLLNDKVAKTDAANNTWRKLRRSFPHEKHFSSYPAIKLGRFAVSKNYRSLGIGTKIMDYLKMLLFKSASYSAFRFLTVDAYISAIPFYERNGFKTLLPEEDDEHTRTMYFDILSLDES